jgi:YbgC/YbaW family acyl-CoA thioester hydrolase
MGRSKEVMVSRLRVQVEFHQVDMMQVVHNAQYLNWFEKGRLDIIERFISVPWAGANDIAVPVVMNHLEYLYPAAFGDELVLTTRHPIVSKWTGRFSFVHSISNAKTKMELCRGSSDVTVMNLSSRRVLKELPAEVWERYQQVSSLLSK